MTERHITTTEAAEALDVPASTIAMWKSRGRIAPVGLIRGPGRGGLVPLYRLEELQPLAAAYHQRRAEAESSRSEP